VEGKDEKTKQAERAKHSGGLKQGVCHPYKKALETQHAALINPRISMDLVSGIDEERRRFAISSASWGSIERVHEKKA
jgi:hypothetical protein